MAKSRSKNKDNARRAKKKTSILNTEGIDYVDWKDVNLLRRFMSDRSKIRARRVTGNDAQQQKEVARAIKNAREMALMPYVTRITQQRGGRGDRGDRGDRGSRGDRDDRGPRGDRDDRGDRGPRGDRDDRAPRPTAATAPPGAGAGASAGAGAGAGASTGGDGAAAEGGAE
jgi:small subunit ribosomal protein S18